MLVGLAQRRFFDRPCAVAMADQLADLLAVFIDTPGLPAGRVWIHGRHPTGDRELLVDDDFGIDGYGQRWRLRADLADGEARAWVTAMLLDHTLRAVPRT